MTDMLLCIRGDASQLRQQDRYLLQAPCQMSISLLVDARRLTPTHRGGHEQGEPFGNAWFGGDACPKLSKPWLVICSIELDVG
jgi:hypothetical protein